MGFVPRFVIHAPVEGDLAVLTRDLDPLMAAFGFTGTAVSRAFVDDLARVWVTSAPADTVLVLRPGPPPALGILGVFAPSDLVALAAVSTRLDLLPQRLRYVDYGQAELDCEALADKLTKRYGPDQLASFHYAAVPRGGLIVLGMLSYLLGLKPRQLDPPSSAATSLVVVDDAAFSGSMFHEFISGRDAGNFVFATLYSHPSLRIAIERADARVTCLSARDLIDQPSQPTEQGGAGFSKVWAERLDRHRYWIGDTDVPYFAWSEPDWSYWNPLTEAVEDGWYLAPPDRCLERRRDGERTGIQVQIQPSGKGPLAPSPRVLFGRLGDKIVLRHLDSGNGFGIEGVAREMWDAIVEHGNLEEAGLVLEDLYDAEPATIRQDLERFSRELLAQDLIEWR